MRWVPIITYSIKNNRLTETTMFMKSEMFTLENLYNLFYILTFLKNYIKSFFFFNHYLK